MLLSVPNEILNRIAFEADSRTRRRLRRTCQLLRDVATPLVFESVNINLSWRRHSSSAPTFLKSLNSGPKLAQHIIHLSLCLPQSFRPYPSRFASEARKKTRDERLDSFDALFLGAISSMVSLKSLFWMSDGESGPHYAKLMFELFGNLPLLSKLKIHGYGNWDVPLSPFRHIRHISFLGQRSNELITFLGYNPDIEIIDAFVWSRSIDDDQSGSISWLFSCLPTGTYSTVKTLRIGGEMLRQLYAYEIPKFIPHLRHLESLTTLINVPDVLWDGLQEHGICLVSLSYHEPTLALLSYLSSYTGLRELSLNMSSDPTNGTLHIASLLPAVITLNSSSLTTVRIVPCHSGAWCLDHPMLDALALCRGLKSLHVCADKARTRVEENNVIDRLLQAFLALWPNLWDLQIDAVSRSYGFEAVRTTASQIHRRILALRFAPLSPERPKVHVSSDFAAYSVIIHDQKNNIHSFKVQYLRHYGEKESWRKYKFWRRSDNTNDD
ncbi:uncharacterized protein BT62DRAFT_997018 [Guyanagaster necrorhizus]|uniref:F-box domain-containing protein n=1 Tax=Guyanagaster necrorhizus TaxID=856835 RepID=A0A9P7VJG1_9AGAR|nr:uncharacterized protein BT62DRAFT_997018 [Guyanagaster necrorhizus MCA 3950]KAG7441737.1 hypothetical protein BT62DRAFT_997018 [Guyanagaster necrorhizus MCA 3950]